MNTKQMLQIARDSGIFECFECCEDNPQDVKYLARFAHAVLTCAPELLTERAALKAINAELLAALEAAFPDGYSIDSSLEVCNQASRAIAHAKEFNHAI